MRRRVLLSLCLLTIAAIPMAGSTPLRPEVKTTINLSSAYLWRGDAVCAFHVAPDVSLSLGNFTLEHYDYLALDGSYKEIDWDLIYRAGDFSSAMDAFYTGRDRRARMEQKSASLRHLPRHRRRVQGVHRGELLR